MIDISFKKNTLEKNIENLSVVIDTDSFFYGLFNGNDLIETKRLDDFDPFKDSHWNPAELLPSDHRFDSINLTIVNDNYLFFTSYPDIEQLRNLTLFENKKIFVDKFTDKNVFIAFGVDRQMINKFDDYFGDYSLQHFSTLLAQLYLYKQGTILHAHFGNDSVHLYHQENNKFVYYNQFCCRSEKDFLYFIAAAEKELNLKLDNQTLYVSGMISQDSKLFELLEAYIYNVIPYTNIPIELPANERNLSRHFYLPLYLSSLCG